MRKWYIRDRDDNEVYLTEEQWQHIISKHGELRHYREDVLDPIRRGRRQQQPKDPQTYVYRLACDTIRPPFNGILVVVAFRFEYQITIGTMPNNFVVTAWGITMRR